MFVTSCQSDEEKIIGKWNIIEFKHDDENAFEQNDESNYFEFEEDGFFIFSAEGEIQRGKWMINKSEKEITLHFFKEYTLALIGKYKIMNDSMRIKGVIGDRLYVFILLGNKPTLHNKSE
jgi:hypothetical protein